MPRHHREALSRASYAGDAEAVRALLAEGLDPNATSDPCYGPPLLEAAEWGHLDVLNVLIDAGADLNLVHKKCCALSLAVDRGRPHIVRRLLALGARAEPVTKDRGAALFGAVASGEDEIALTLLEVGADASAVLHRTPLLLLAARQGSPELIRALLEHGADAGATEEGRDLTPLWFAVSADNADAIPPLLEADHELEALSRACILGDGASVRSLLASGVSPNVKDARAGFPLVWASSRGHPSVVELLLEYGAEVDVRGPWDETALLAASDRGDTTIVRMLLQRGASIDVSNRSGWSVLASASRAGHETIVRTLIEAGADVNQHDSVGMTALHSAAGYGRGSATRLLIATGAQINVRNVMGQTPLMMAAESGFLSTVRVLLDHGAEVNAVSESGWTALKYAAAHDDESTAITEALRLAGAVE